MTGPELKLEDLVVSSNESLKNALRRMTQNRKGVVFVCDENLHLLGTLSDGDVRRSLLDDTLLVAPVSKAMNLDPIMANTVEQAQQLLQKYSAVAVPVVDADCRILKLVVADANANGPKVLKRANAPSDTSAHLKSLNAVALIPARGGSKRIPRKNLAVAGGHSLLGWAVLAAKNAKQVGHVLVSTDDNEIADAARTLGVEIPWLRPAELSQDHVASLDVLIHALNWAVKNYVPAPEFGVLLEPTAPLRKPEHVDHALTLLANSDADSVVTVCEVPHTFNPEELLIIERDVLRPYVAGGTMDTRKLRGQHSPAYVLSGLVYAFRIRVVLEQRSLYGRKTLPLVTPWEYYLDVDTFEDLRWADFKISQLSARPGPWDTSHLVSGG
jgi:CMP-N-acetylneuraminic acid synthetase